MSSKVVRLVVDTSVIIKWLSSDNEAHLDQATKILEDVESNRVELYAPELSKYEVGNVLLFGKHLQPSQAKVVLDEFYRLPITFVSQSVDEALEVFALASKLAITYYDAAFLSVAKIYGASLVTENMKHQGKATDIKVIALQDY
jgi:predicted nucleic acid-binding protein